MRQIHLSAFAGLVLFGGSIAGAVVIDLVPVGNPGNVANSGGLGSVGYNYQIGRTEISNSQYASFLNAVDPTGSNARQLYNSNMTTAANVYDTGGIDLVLANGAGSRYVAKTDKASNPVIWVSWNDGARFANWLHNGQGSGSTETGVYDMSLSTPVRSANADYVIPNQNEWMKAAYFDPNKNGGGPGYWTYATSSDSTPTSGNPASLSNPTNSANFIGPAGFAVTGSDTQNTSQNYLTDVGAYTQASSFYGTFDQSGNVYEWNEDPAGGSRVLRGGAWEHISFYLTNSSPLPPDAEGNFIGFRIALIPEPASLATLALAAPLFLRRQRRSV